MEIIGEKWRLRWAIDRKWDLHDNINTKLLGLPEVNPREIISPTKPFTPSSLETECKDRCITPTNNIKKTGASIVSDNQGMHRSMSNITLNTRNS